jgi:hypothetical protein
MSLDPATADRLKSALATGRHARRAAPRRFRRGHDHLGRGQAVRGTAGRQLIGRQRQRGQEALAQPGVCGRAVRPPSRTLPEAARARIAGILAAWNLPRAEEAT